MIYLYKKIHKKTGLKYLGQTSRQDPYKYPGSGKWWRAHLDKHGYDFDTEILFESDNKTEIRNMGIYYSELWNVVKSSDWANLKPESGDGGTFVHSEEAKQKIGDARRGLPGKYKGKTYNEIIKDPIKILAKVERHKDWMKDNNPFKGKTHSVESSEKMREAAKKRNTLTEEERKSSWGHLKGKPWSEARRLAHLERKNKGKQ